MPINFLGNIKLSESPNGESLDHIHMLNLAFRSEHVLGAYVFSCKDLKSDQPLFNDGLPSLILMPERSAIVNLKKGEQKIKLESAWVCCGVIQNTYWQLPDNLEYVIVLRFKPSSFYGIFKIEPTFFYTKPYCNLSEINNEGWNRNIDQLYQKDSIADRMQFLRETLNTYPVAEDHPYILQSALEKIEYKKGNISVSELIYDLGGRVNRKWLQRSFLKHIGISPKKYISLQRFIFMYGHYQNSPSNDLITNIFLSGYYDYNHFLKEFKQYVGVSPSKYSWD